MISRLNVGSEAFFTWRTRRLRLRQTPCRLNIQDDRHCRNLNILNEVKRRSEACLEYIQSQDLWTKLETYRTIPVSSTKRLCRGEKGINQGSQLKG